MSSFRRSAALISAAGLVAAGLSVAGGAATAAPTTGCDNRTNDSLRKVLDCVTLDGVLEHEEALQAVADANGGTRASGSTGYDESAAYVADRLRSAGYDVSVQEFDFVSFEDLGGSELDQVSPLAVSYVEGTDFGATPQSEPGEVTAPVTAVDLDLGLGNASTSGCEPEDFIGFTPGHIALLQRGACTFQLKAENAAAAGAVAVVFFNQGNTDDPSRTGIPAVTLSAGYTGGIPALNATYDLGVDLAATPGLVLHLLANVVRETTTTANVIADSRGGDPANVVMAGAHLDSVNEGPGINDNGSGSSALLEVAEQVAKAANKGKLAHQVRFAWWGAEESGLVGSTHYVNALTDEEIADLEMYLNFDMVGSPNYGLFIYDGDGSGFGLVGPVGSDDIEALFEKFYADRGIPSEPTAFSGRSDYQAFINNGVPSGGLFTGAEGIKTEEQAAKWGGVAGEAYDSCYHQACDTIDNLSHEALEINADAIAYVVYLYASGQASIN
ncbi:M28 family metallopeptidase [Nocardioides sp. YIM 152588]|uniref:M28 family metallopeptidase n=1 Tax=Nocardioides sp. YIM 152588 TaxID=3158259 RepID=UPI0032E41BCF